MIAPGAATTERQMEEGADERRDTAERERESVKQVDTVVIVVVVVEADTDLLRRRR